MSNEKQQFMEAVNKVLIQFESARRSQFFDEPNDAYQLSQNQREDLKRFLLLNGMGQVSLQTATRSEVRDIVVLFSILGLLVPKGRVVVMFSNKETLEQIFSKTAMTWYQLLGVSAGLALGTKEDSADLPSMNIIFTTRKFVDSDKQMKHLLADAEVHAWESPEETSSGWKVTQSQSWQGAQPQTKKWWEFWK